ncbi:chromosome replication initiation protein/membrane attachment protein, partial [Streptococcus agalactiae GB00959]
DMKIPKNARDISKKFTDVFSDLGQPKQEVNRSKNVFDLESFKRLMMRDGLRFNNEKDDVLGIYSVSELYHLNWYDTYQLAKQTAINGMIAPQRMKVQQNEGQHIKDNQSFTNNEKVILRESKNDSALVFLEKIKRSRKAVTTSGEKTLLEDLAKMNFLDEVINVMVLYTLNKTKSANLNKAYIMKVANDFAFQNVMTAEDAVLKIRDFSDQKVRTKTETKKKQSNVPEWSNPDYKDEVSPEKEIELEQFKTDALKRLERLGKDGES